MTKTVAKILLPASMALLLAGCFHNTAAPVDETTTEEGQMMEDEGMVKDDSEGVMEDEGEMMKEGDAMEDKDGDAMMEDDSGDAMEEDGDAMMDQ